MEPFDPRIDAYISKSQPFAQPILTFLRELIHNACPDVLETIKWGMPFFDYKGTMCHIAAFKQHTAFGFWKGKLMTDPAGKLVFGEGQNAAMGHFGRISSLEDLPDKNQLAGYIKEAMRLNAEGVKVENIKKNTAAPKPEMEIPAYLTEALEAQPTALKNWQAFAPSHRKKYLQWITEAKTEPTKQKRLAAMLEWVAEGKKRH